MCDGIAGWDQEVLLESRRESQIDRTFHCAANWWDVLQLPAAEVDEGIGFWNSKCKLYKSKITK